MCEVCGLPLIRRCVLGIMYDGTTVCLGASLGVMSWLGAIMCACGDERGVAERPIMSHAFVERTSGGQAACACGEVPIALCAFKVQLNERQSQSRTQTLHTSPHRHRPASRHPHSLSCTAQTLTR